MIIGIDGGGTSVKFVALREGEAKSVYRETLAEPGNFLAIGADGFKNLLERIFARVGVANLSETKLLLGLAGSASVEARSSIRRVCNEVGVLEANVEIVTDAELGMLALQNEGILLIAGTGAVCIGRYNGKVATAGGWGYLVGGDAGSAFHLGSSAITMVARRVDGINQHHQVSHKDLDELELMILRHYGARAGRELSTLIEIRPLIYARGRERDAVASLAVGVFELADKGNAAAKVLIAEVAAASAALLRATYLRLGEGGSIRLGLYGGMFSSEPGRTLLKELILNDRLMVDVKGSFVPVYLSDSANGECLLTRAIRYRYSKLPC